MRLLAFRPDFVSCALLMSASKKQVARPSARSTSKHPGSLAVRTSSPPYIRKRAITLIRRAQTIPTLSAKLGITAAQIGRIKRAAGLLRPTARRLSARQLTAIGKMARRGLLTREIAAQLKLTKAQVRRARSKLGLPGKSGRLAVLITPDIRNRVVSLSQRFQTLHTISEEAGIPVSRVLEIKREAGSIGSHRTLLTEKMRGEVLRLARAGKPIPFISKQVGVARSVVGRIKRENGLTQPRPKRRQGGG